ncbi:predicted protein [Naegleria gruberi]|uniref:Predicted protein n=1 Tax=Naegleria gruberi TaxID=5762 RepID=D2V7X8_NAEGR|nr:uncharacterized protein NAEGRDRAFT_31919 [Naegleria gruberi]EFC46942.1 predicted protein [Naegleria gruberi]|eukprot:XP_002679686.1 predicted protein [Naegleria gruberi strain NEG-M]
MLNQPCTSFSELKQVGDFLLANHKKPVDSYASAKDVKIDVAEPVHIESEDEYNKIVKKNRLLVLDFFATWCCPCTSIAPKFTQLANKYKDAVFVKVDVDQQPSIMSRYEVNCMPTFVFIKDGAVIDRLEGADSKTLESKVKSLVELLQ